MLLVCQGFALVSFEGRLSRSFDLMILIVAVHCHKRFFAPFFAVTFSLYTTKVLTCYRLALASDTRQLQTRKVKSTG